MFHTTMNALKTTVLTLLIASLALLPAVSAQDEKQGPEIEMVAPWPSDVGDGDYLYTDARIDRPGSAVDSAWFEVKQDGEQVGRGTLSDSVGDGYYVSPAGVQVDGGETYTVEVNACSSGSCASTSTTVETSCTLEFMDDCLY